MKVKAHLLIGLALILSANAFTFAQELIDGVDLTTTKAPWTMRILGNGLDITDVQAKPDEASAYFMMKSESLKLNVSVFIEPADKCKTSEGCRDHVLNLGNPAWGKFEQSAKGKIKDFYYFEFYRPEVKGQPLKMLDMYAQYVSDGYWVDLHISKVLFTKEDHALFERVVNSVAFIPRTQKQEVAFELQRAKGHMAVVEWLSLWEQKKCKESYAALSATTRSDVAEMDWSNYCAKLTLGLGSNRSRKPVAVAYTRSLPGKTDRPVAIHAYHSTFANQPSVVELVALMLEKDGTWKVTNYIPR